MMMLVAAGTLVIKYKKARWLLSKTINLNEYK